MAKTRLMTGDVRECLAQLKPGSVHCAITSPPYFAQRVYEGLPDSAEWLGGVSLGNEPLADCLAWAHGEPPCSTCYVCHMRQIFMDLSRVLRDDGTLWLNLGDKYAGSGGAGGDYNDGGLREGQPRFGRAERPKGKLTGGTKTVDVATTGLGGDGRLPAKNLYGIPWRVALALQSDGWVLRSEVIWHKRSAMPQSATDRPTVAHEQIFLLSKGPRYFYDADAERTQVAESSLDRIKYGFEASKATRTAAGTNDATGMLPHQLVPANGANLRTVWPLGPEPQRAEHYASYPTEIPKRAIRLGTSEKGVCTECGAPWVRVVKASGGTIGKGWHDHKDDMQVGMRDESGGKSTDGTYKRETTGWAPSCEHDAGTVPATVLDPFSGTATTGVAALGNNRNYIGIDASAKYTAIAWQRLRKTRGILVEEQAQSDGPAQLRMGL